MAGISRYLIAVFVIFYTFHCFAVFSYKHEEDRTVFYIFQNVLMVLTHALAFYVLFVKTGDPSMLIICVVEEIMFFVFIIVFKYLYPRASRLITNNICMLLCIGFIMLARLSMTRATRQLITTAISMIIAAIVPYLIQKIYLVRYYYWAAAIAGLGILLAMLTKGTVTNGSRISLTVLGFTFLPSDLVKLLYIFFIAGMLTDEDHIDPDTGRADRPQLIASGIVALSYVGVLALCRDLGSALIFFIICLFMFYAAYRMPVILIGGTLGMGAASVVGYKAFAHVRNRVSAWRDPFADVEGNGYQIAQSLFAIGTGSWFGLGLMGGSPKSIPEVSKDFMFAAITEEMGALVGLCVILISLSNFLMFMNISIAIRDPYLKYMSLGLGVNYGFQVILTIGGVTKFIPLTGITLPLVSYGGSSIMSTLTAFAIIQGLYIMKDDLRE